MKNNKKIVQKIVLAGVIIDKDNKILILQRNKDEDIFPEMWELPSGKREFFEDYESCLIREIKEETGLDVNIIMPFSVFDYQIEELGEIRDTTQINFLVKVVNEEKVKLSPEHQNFVWISKNDIKKYKLSKATKKVILKAFELIPKLK